MLNYLTSTEVREHLSETLNRVSYGNDRFLITRQEKDVAAIVSVADLELLQRIRDAENRIDAREAKRILENPNRKDFSIEEVRAELEEEES